MTELMSPANIREEFNVRSRDTTARWQALKGFPKPKLTVDGTRLYDAAEVRAWHAAFKGDARKQRVLELWRTTPRPTLKAIGADPLVEVSGTTVGRWLIELGVTS